MAEREEWTSRSGFILASIGSAVGIGNIWRFSYVAGENGGGAFLVIYLVSVALVGLPIIMAELVLGRRAHGDAVAAFQQPGKRSPWRHIGWIGVVGALVILSYYAVIAGWALKYFVGATSGALWEAAAAGYGTYFRQFIAHAGEPVVFQAAMLGATVYVVGGGVRKGIEAINRWLMPVLAGIVVALALSALTLPGSERGLAFLFTPDWSVLAQPRVYIAALGQAFFSLGVGMAVFITFGSYMPRSFPLPASAATIAIGDTLFAVIAGMAIFPAVFAFGIDPSAGPELAFITLPQVFLQMPAGRVLGAVFFFLLSAAALTSMVSLLEVPVATAMSRLNWPRRRAAMVAGGTIFILGLPSALSFGTLAHLRVGGLGILDAIDLAVSNVLLPVGGILIALYCGWRLERTVAMAEAELAAGWVGTAWLWLLRIVAPVAVAAILLGSVGSL